jgi:uncharacterized protein YkwD
VIRATAIGAIERCLAVFVTLAVQIVAALVIGDLFAAAPGADAGLPPPSDVVARVARVAPVARGERLMISDLTTDVVTETASPASADLASEPSANVAPQDNADPAPMAPAAVAPDPTPAPTPLPAPPALSPAGPTGDAELRMLALMNASRLQQGLVPLALDARASDAARRHSAVEADHRYVYHDGPDGMAASRNVPACGTGWYGENTGKVWGGGVDVLHHEFMAEPWAPINHRTNIMDPNFRRAGVGAVQGPDAVYVTVVFCR